MWNIWIIHSNFSTYFVKIFMGVQQHRTCVNIIFIPKLIPMSLLSRYWCSVIFSVEMYFWGRLTGINWKRVWVISTWMSMELDFRSSLWMWWIFLGYGCSPGPLNRETIINAMKQNRSNKSEDRSGYKQIRQN